ncbi:hypothetical protein BC777_2065 [Yoonia maricola]|uniref:Uncharacterized protein n=2 Tax=Yoonia maricola TaxID=420999 RepID=A0A2M8WQM6_9RHOB|nr:hypothetical protein BC777_2065 [Yoonia maricola]
MLTIFKHFAWVAVTIGWESTVRKFIQLLQKSSISCVMLPMFLGLGTSAHSGGLSGAIEEAPIVAETDRGWHVLGVEASLSYGELDGKRILTSSADNNELNVDYPLQSFDLALNIASGDLAPGKSRWIISPFLTVVMDGAENLEVPDGGATVESGDFDWHEIGLRVEQERYLTDMWSWTIGGNASLVDAENTLVVETNGNLRIKENEGWRAGLYVGANAKLSENFTITSRLGYDWAAFNESAQCLEPGGGGDCRPVASDDDDTEIDGAVASIGVRYSF